MTAVQLVHTFSYQDIIVYMPKMYFAGNSDECVTAGEIYSCGKDKEPTIVNAIFNAEKGNTTMVDFNKCAWLSSKFNSVFATHTLHSKST
jgi:hypothetical protein